MSRQEVLSSRSHNLTTNPKPIQWSPYIKLAVCVPCERNILAAWAFHFMRFTQFLPPDSKILFKVEYGVAQSRELLYQEVLKELPEFTHILFLDSDVMPDVPALVQLFSDDKPVVGGVCYAPNVMG